MLRLIPLLCAAALAAACGASDPGTLRLGETSAPSVSPSATDDTDFGAVVHSPSSPPIGIPIRVDQFGYRPGDPKVAVLADPVEGFDAANDYEPGSELHVLDASDGTVVLTGPPVPWRGGQTDPQAGDRGWWFDFTEVTAPGEYVVYDPENDRRGDVFTISDDVYDALLDAALKMFWFNRLGADHPATYGGPWADTPAYVGSGQDGEARSIDAHDDASLARDLRGGWADAGDTNKYVTFAADAVHQLLAAYQQYPQVFDDSVGIPESGNGVPDVLDEVRWEIEWLERMQQDDGGVLTKVGVTTYNEPPGAPSESGLPRFYEEVCSSATIAAAGMFAHAALVFGAVDGWSSLATRLEGRAVNAWDWYGHNERRDDCDPQEVLAGDADWSLPRQDAAEVVAAVYLYALTGDADYGSVVSSSLEVTAPFTDVAFGRYLPHESDAVLFYRDLPGADPETAARIDARLAEVLRASTVYGFDEDRALYRSAMPDIQYHWGSNRVLANIGAANLTVAEIEGGLERALAHLHTFHGVNPLTLVYLTNSGSLGAERSVQELFHFWFGEGSAFDVGDGSNVGTPPGYVVGGPNWGYSGSVSPPAGQPPMKSYLDSNGRQGEPIWELSEPAIYYQSAYVRLLSAVLGSGT